MKKGIALMTMLIIGLIVFVSATVIVFTLKSKNIDPHIGNVQAQIIVASQEIDAQKLFFESLLSRQGWVSLRASTAVPLFATQDCPAYTGRRLFAPNCNVLNDQEIAKQMESALKAKVFVKSTPQFVEIIGSSGDYKLLQKSIDTYDVHLGGFIDAKTVLSLPSLKVEDVQAYLRNCEDEDCLQRYVSGDWILQKVKPIEGLSVYNGFVADVMQQFSKCANIQTVRPCWCALTYEPATSSDLNVAFKDKKGFVLKNEGGVLFSDPDGFSMLVNKKLQIRKHDPPQTIEVFSNVVLLPPTTNMPIIDLTTPLGNDRLSIESGFVVDRETIALLQEGSTLPSDQCVSNDKVVTVKFTSKKVYPPDATPLVFYIAFDLKSAS